MAGSKFKRLLQPTLAIFTILLKFDVTLSLGAVKDISDKLPKDSQFYCFGYDSNSNIDQELNLMMELERCSVSAPVTHHTKSQNGKIILYCTMLTIVNVYHVL